VCSIRPILRAAKLSELIPLQALIQRAYRGQSARGSWSHEGELPAEERISHADLAELIQSPRSKLTVAVAAGRLVGSSLVTRDSPGGCAIGLISVDPDFQCRGVGNQLLGHAEICARNTFAAEHADVEVLEHNSRLVAYYEKRGYRQSGETRPYPHDLKAPARFLVLRKRLLSVI
jgi:ribosomal protein S18 acetylase RimI-like enzyme